jgi:predicted nucleic acid-binding protein
MPPSPSRLTSAHRRLVLDASVMINLLGTGAMHEVIAALARELHIERKAFRELKFDPAAGGPAAATLAPVLDGRRLLVVDLPGEMIAEFVQLATAGARNGLHDGEAASIVLAQQLNAAVVLDEDRAQRAARRHFPGIEVLTSVDLLAAPEVFEAFGEQRVSDLIFASCMKARMRVANEVAPWVVEIIGPRVEQCLSIRKRFRVAAKWS